MAKKSKDSNKSVSVNEQPREAIREAVFASQFCEDMKHWSGTDPKLAVRAWEIIENVMKTPFSGIAKPEPLKYIGSDIWSRRLTLDDRIVYKVQHTRIDFLNARYHYKS